MKNKKVKFCAALLLGLGLPTLHSQEASIAAGGDATGSGGSASYSIGQAIYTTNTGSNGSVAQGVQQPYEIYLVTAINEVTGINLNLSAFPNPTSDFLILKIENEKLSNINFQLFDITGKVLETNKIVTSETNISLVNYPYSTYFLKIHLDNKEVRIFKIIKN